MKSNKGKIIIISSPSGGGKTSICRRLQTRNKKDNWVFSISYTTRPPRPNETSGVEYHFVNHARFIKLRNKGEFAESCQVHRYYYGTPRQPMEKIISKGGIMLLDVDIKGAWKLKDEYPKAATIFILPPSRAELKKRLKQRGTEDDKHLKIRQKRALNEMKAYKKFEYIVINEDLNTAVKEVEMIIKSLHCRKGNLDFEKINRIIG